MVPLVLGPEFLNSVSLDQAVVVVCVRGQIERWMSAVKSEKNHPEREEIGVVTLIRLLGEHFRCHVARCSDNGAIESRTIASLKSASEAEVNEFDIVVAIHQNVLRFEITVRKAFRVDVKQTLKHLSGIKLHDRL